MDSPQFTLRASSLPEIMICPGAAQPVTGVRIRCDSEPAELGNAAHEVAALVAAGHDLDDIPVDNIAERYKVEASDLHMLGRHAARAWSVLAPYFRPEYTESETKLVAQLGEHIALSGHTDLQTKVGPIAYIIDWKSGRVDRDYRHQIMAYMHLFLYNNPEVTEVQAWVVWLREDEAEPYRMTRETMAEWVAEIEERIVRWDGVYHPHRGCVYCPRAYECPALLAMAKRDVAIFLDGASYTEAIANGLKDLPSTTIVDLFRRAKMVTSLAEELRNQIKDLVTMRGPQDGGDGYHLVLQTRNKREVLPMKAWPILEAELTPEELGDSVTVHLSKINDFVKKKAPPRQGAAAIRELDRNLRDKEAIKVTKTYALTEVRSINLEHEQ